MASSNDINPYYEEDGVVIYNADCRDILPQLGKVDVVITDPPYGIGASKGDASRKGWGHNSNGRTIQCRSYPDTWDDYRPHPDVLQLILGKCETALIFGGNYLADLLPRSSHWIVWDKSTVVPSFSDCELIWTNSARTSVKKYTVQFSGLMGAEPNRCHPTQKPLRLLHLLIQDYGGQSILDPFMGSGTTLVAAKNLGRRAIGIEIEEKYCEIAVNRLRQSVFSFVRNGHAT